MAAINYGAVSGGDGGGGTDSGIVDDGGSTATLMNEALSAAPFTKKAVLSGTVRIDDLEANELVVLRIDVLLGCQFGSSPTGNRQAKLADSNTFGPVDAIPGGAQTTPFKQTGDVPQFWQITIVKVAVPQDEQDFDFTTTSNTSTDLGGGAFILDDNGNEGDAQPSSRTFTDLAPGTYTATEPGEAGWDLTDITCVEDGDQDSSDAGSTATVELNSGESVTCTFTNTANIHPGTIGFWRNWDNHYDGSTFNGILSDLGAANAAYLGVDATDIDGIFKFGKGSTNEQKLLAQLTALKLNLAVSETGNQMNDDICLAGTVNVSRFADATLTGIFGASANDDVLDIEEVVTALEGALTGTIHDGDFQNAFTFDPAETLLLTSLLSASQQGLNRDQHRVLAAE